MRLRNFLPLTALAAFLMLAGCESSADDAGGEPPTYTIGEPLTDPSLAVIVSSDAYGSDTLTAEEFQGRIEQVQTQMPTIENDVAQMEELRRRIVEGFVLNYVLLGEADRRGITSDTAAVEMRLAQLQRRMGGSERFEQLLADRDLTRAELRHRLRRQMRLQATRRALAEEAEAPTEAELAAFREEQALEVRAQHVFFPLPRGASAAAEDSVRALATAVLDSIQRGALSFAEAVQRHSAGNAGETGSLGYFRRSEMVDPFAEAAFALEDSGAVVDEPVRTRYGFHIIRKTGQRMGTPPDSARARALMMRERRREALRQNMYRLRAMATVRINPDVVEGVDLEEPYDLFEPRS